MASDTYYAVRDCSPNRATICEMSESIVRWWGPAGHVVGDRVWTGGLVGDVTDADRREDERRAGRPPTTRSASTPTVHYRVSAVQWAEISDEAARRGVTPNEIARRRAFPASDG